MPLPEIPNVLASTADFEFEALREANNYRHTLIEEFAPHLRGNLIEIGCGIGQMTELLAQDTNIARMVAIEPDGAFAKKHREKFPGHHLIEGTIDSVDPHVPWNTILSINVLEHIGDDEGELARYANLLRKEHGHLCLFVPARAEIYAPIDRDFGHFRRYSRTELRSKLSAAGFEIVRLDYFNFAGYFAWWLNFCLLNKRTFEANKVRFYDRVIFPVVHALESRVMRPPIGQSLIAVARA